MSVNLVMFKWQFTEYLVRIVMEARLLLEQIGSSSKLSTINLSNNLLVGAIPSEIGQLSEIRSSIDLSNNQLSGALPSEIGRLYRMSKWGEYME